MPSYSYKCPECNREYSIVLSIFDNKSQYCEDDSAQLVKIFGAPPIHFKGGGWGGN